MISREKAIELINKMESDRIERTISFSLDKLGPVTCAFSNDFANNKKSGYILLGVNDDGKVNGMNITDELLTKIGDLKSNGNILPQPSIIVSEVFKIDGGDVVVVEVMVSNYPPVRYNGRCFIRIGPRNSIASVNEENILSKKRIFNSFDITPVKDSSIGDLLIEHFKLSYLPKAIDKEILEVNGRSIEEQLAALRFYDLNSKCPTNAGILVFGKNPLYFLPCAYIQYVKFAGNDMISNVEYEKVFSGSLITQLHYIVDFIKINILKEKPIKTDGFKEEIMYNYPLWALRELILNAIMHRNYTLNSPIYIYEFSNRIEIHNPGGLPSDLNPKNFPNESSYRNIILAEVLKNLGFVNRFNYGIKRAISLLENNGNGKPDFNFSIITKFVVKIYINSKWKN